MTLKFTPITTEYTGATRVVRTPVSRGMPVSCTSIPAPKCLLLLMSMLLATSPALGQQGRPEPAAPPEPEPIPEVVEEIEEVAEPTPEDETIAQEAASTDEVPAEAPIDPIVEDAPTQVPPTRWTTDGIRDDRRAVKDEPVVLAFKDVKLNELIELIALETGKIVMPIGKDTSTSRKEFTIVADQPMPRQEALDFILTYLRINDIGIIEREHVIFIGPLDEMATQLGEIEVVPAGVSLADRQERGVLIFKIFQIEQADAGQIKDDIAEFFPDQWAKMREDDLSNQLMVLGDIGLCQQIEAIIADLDRKWLQPEIATFRLKYADAREIEANILDLFEQSTSGSSANRTSSQNRGRTNQRGGGGSSPANSGSSQGPTEAELRLTVNEQQNTVTVQGEAETISQIGGLIETEWDLPRPEGTSRLFTLKHTDPIKVKDLLISVLGAGGSSSSSSSSSRTNNRSGGQSSQRTDATVGIAGVYQIEAYPDRNALLVLSKTVQSFDFIQSIIERIDEPSNAGLPEIIPLKYADAVSLTEELNILLARAGSGRASLPRPDAGLSAEGFGASDGGGVNITGPDNSSTSQDLQFPWGNNSDADSQSPESALIGKVRIVPIVRQNALAILAPPAYQEPMRKLIEAFDQPRRQVMLSATIIEVDLGDALNLGMKIGKDFSPNQGAIVAGPMSLDIASQSLSDLFSPLFDGGVIWNLGPFDVNLIVEALNTVTNTRIIQEPRVFTADNEEAVFFAGEEFPVATGTVDAASGGLNTSTTIEYKNVGVFLNVRPRITEEGAVDLSVSVEISNVQDPSYSVGNTESAIFGRKQVTTQAVLLDGQTIVLGGLLKEAELITRDRIPGLADIPLIGQFFEFSEERLERTELLVFITPTVVHRPVDNYTNFNVQDIERLDAIARPLAEQLAESQKAIDMNVHRRLTKMPGGISTPKGPPSHRVILPDRDPVQSEIDRFQPELIELQPHDPSTESKSP